MRSPKWMKFFPTDFWGDERVGALTPHAACAYLSLLTLAWQAKGRLLSPVMALRRVGFAEAEAEALWSEIRTVAEWFEVEGGWTQNRVWEEWQEAERQRLVAAEMGRRGGKKSGESRSKPTLQPTPKPTSNRSSTSSSSREKGAGSSSRLRDCARLLPDEFPELARAPGVADAWGEWLAYRQDKRKRVSVRAAREQLREGAAWGAAAFVASIRASIRNDWQGLFEPKSQPPPQGAPTLDWRKKAAEVAQRGRE